MIGILLKPLFHQIASLLNDTSSVLNECIGAFSQPQELKVLLDNQKDLTQLEDIGELNILKHGISSQHVVFLFFSQNLFYSFMILVPFRVFHR